MRGMKGKLMKKLKSIKPIGYLKQDRVLQVNAADGFIETLPINPSCKVEAQLIFREAKGKENVEETNAVSQEPDIIDVSELMRDLEDEDLEVDEEEDDVDDKENVSPLVMKTKGAVGSCVSSFRPTTPLSEIDIPSFRPPDLNSGSLFDPNLLTAFEEAVKEHTSMSESVRKARVERELFERKKQEEKQSRIQEEDFEKRQEKAERNLARDEGEPPLKARRIEEDDIDEDPLLAFEEKCPPGGSDTVIFYTTTLRGIRKTFEDCNSVRFLLESFRVLFYERDVSMHMEFKKELWKVLNCKAMPPRLFIKGRYIGGAEEILALHEQGKLRVLFEGIPIDRANGPCGACAGVRFVLCFNCNGSHRVIANDGLPSECGDCNENGLMICPYCC